MEGPVMKVTMPTFSLKKTTAGIQVAMMRSLRLVSQKNWPDLVFRNAVIFLDMVVFRNAEKIRLLNMVARGPSF